MIKTILIRILRTSLLIFLIYGILYWINPGERFRANLDKYKITDCEKASSEFITTCKDDLLKAELTYFRIKQLLGASMVNKHVNVYKAEKILDDGIGYYQKNLVGGIFLNGIFADDTIVYNGDYYVLAHEFVHHFYAHMPIHYKNEVFARSIEAYLELVNNYGYISNENRSLKRQLLNILLEKTHRNK